MTPIVASGRRNKEENLSMPALMRGMLADEAEDELRRLPLARPPGTGGGPYEIGLGLSL